MQRLNWKIATRMIVSAGLLVWLFLLNDWKDIGHVWSGVQPGWIVAAIACIVVSMIVSVRKWQLVLDAQGMNLSWSELWKCYWAGLFFNNFLPSSMGGDALRIWWIGNTTHDNPGATSSVVVERILATAGLAITGLMAAAFVISPDERAVTLFVILIIVSLVLMGIICWGALPRWTQHRQGLISSFLRDMAGHGIKLRHRPGRLVRVATLSAVFQLLVVAVNYCIFQALHVTALTWWDLIYVIPVISVAAMLPLGINGYGLREGAYVVLLGFYQIPASTALSCSLLFVFLVSLCSLYGGYTWYNHGSKGEITDVKVPIS